MAETDQRTGEDRREANRRQVGGNHYGALQPSYQHWDLAADTGMGYFEGQITKYVARWRRKNGVQDLEKALHYAEKLLELIRVNRYPLRLIGTTPKNPTDFLHRFVIEQQLTPMEETVFELCIFHALIEDVEKLVHTIQIMITACKANL